MPDHKSHKLEMKHMWETPNYHRLETQLQNGRTWYIYVPKDPKKITTVYAGSFESAPIPDPPTQDCDCKGAHYHAPPQYRRRTAKKTAGKRSKKD